MNAIVNQLPMIRLDNLKLGQIAVTDGGNEVYARCLTIDGREAIVRLGKHAGKLLDGTARVRPLVIGETITLSPEGA